MQTSLIEKQTTQTLTNLKLNNKGLSLIEILVALTLASVIIVASVGNPLRDERDFLDDSLGKVERAIRLASDESVLRNSITRVLFDLTRQRAEISVQYSTGSGFVLPDISKFYDDNLSQLDRQEQQKKQKKLDAEFKDVEEFSEEMKYLHENIRLIGVGTSLTENVVRENPIAIYFYPTGERDGSIVFMGSIQEIVHLQLSPFTGKVVREYVTIEEGTEVEEFYENEVDDIFDRWKRN